MYFIIRKRTRKSYAQTMYEATSSDLVFLFDLEKDPNETMNLAKTERKVTKRMMKKIRALIRSGQVVKPDTPFLRERSLPKYWEGGVSPGWCKAKQWHETVDSVNTLAVKMKMGGEKLRWKCYMAVKEVGGL